MSYEEAFEDTHAAIDSLQQCIGKNVTSYRAPAFSIGRTNKWAFEVLAANGITCDASVFPAARDFGGFPEFSKMEPTIVRYNGQLKCLERKLPILEVGIFGSFLIGSLKRK